MEVAFIGIALAFWLICGCLGYAMAQAKEAEKFGFWLGFLLGPIGLVAILAIDGRASCPTCGTKLNGKPEMCPACKTRFKWDGNVADYFPPE